MLKNGKDKFYIYIFSSCFLRESRAPPGWRIAAISPDKYLRHKIQWMDSRELWNTPLDYEKQYRGKANSFTLHICFLIRISSN